MALSEDKFYKARILSRKDLAHDLWTIRLAPGGEFKFVAGQYCTLGGQVGEKFVERAYSIVSSPYEEELELFFELVPEGEFTPFLHKLPAGSELHMRKIAKGRFTLDLKSGHKNHLLVATVTGVAPYVSYIRTLYKDWKQGQFPADIHLYAIQAASRSFEFGYWEELKKIADEVPWLDAVASVSRPWEDAGWTGEVGRAEDILRKYSDQWGLSDADTTAYLCGHPQMLENGLGILQRRGFDKKSIKSEAYWVPAKESES